MHLFRALDAKWSSSRLPRTFVTTAVAGAIAITAWVLIMASAPLAQQAPLHLNPAIEKLAQGKPIIGTNTSDRWPVPISTTCTSTWSTRR